MTEQDMLLTAGLASLALAITLGDLLFSLWRHRRKVSQDRTVRLVAGNSLDEAATAARRATIRRRLTAIQTADDGEIAAPVGNGSSDTPTPAGRGSE